MSNAYSYLTTGNTFGDWIVTTNGLVFENNNFNANNYHKAAGTLILDEPTTSLQANGIAIFTGYLHSTGPSGTQVDYNLTVGGQTYLTNTILSLTASGQANMNGLVICQAPNTSLYVANNANVTGNVAIVGNTSIGNNLFVTGNTTSYNTYTTGSTVTIGNTYTNTLQSNVFVNTALITVTGPAYSAFLQANNYVNTALITVTGNTYSGNIKSNGALTVLGTSVLTGQANTLSDVGIAGNFYLAGNSNTTGNVYVTGNQTIIGKTILTGQANTLADVGVAGNFYLTGNQVVTGKTTLTGQANTISDLGVAGNSYITGNQVITGKTTLTSSANALVDFGVSNNLWLSGNLNVNQNINMTTGTLTVPYLLLMNSGGSANITNLTANTLTVLGNFVQTLPLIYNATSFTLSQASPITPAQPYASFSAYRTGANATIRWDETNKYWATLNVTSGIYNQITTKEQFSNLGNDTSTNNVATAYALASANTFLQANMAATLLTSQNYANTIVAANISSLQTTIQSQIASNVVSLQTTLQSQISSNISTLSSSANASNLTSGTIPAARLPSSGVSSGTYGGTTQIPVLNIDSTGRVTSAANTAVSSTLPIGGVTGTGSVSLLSQTLTVTSGNTSVITTSASNQSITISPVASGVTAGAYGSSTAIPVITVDTFGRVQSLTTTSISTSITLAGTSGSGSVSGGGTLTFSSNNGVVHSIQGSTVYTNTPQDLRSSAIPNFYNLTLSTAMPVTSGGTGTTSSTGSGSVVLSSSPTITNASLTTPALGKPSSGDLSNCTNYGGGISSSQVLTALGYTPYSASNPNGYITSSSIPTRVSQLSNDSGYITSASIPTNLSSFTNGPGYITSSSSITGTASNITAYTINQNLGTSNSPTFNTVYAGSFYSSSGGTNSTYGDNYISCNGGYSISAGGSGSYSFDTGGNFTAPGNVTAYSDIRLKSNITTITNALDIVNSMRGVRFDKDGNRGVGVIAQEIREVLPEVVIENEDENKTLSVAYGNISGVLIEAIKELSSEIEKLKAEIKELKGK